MVPIVAVSKLAINVVVDKGGTIKLLAATARLLLLFLYCIDSMFILVVRTIAQHD